MPGETAASEFFCWRLTAQRADGARLPVGIKSSPSNAADAGFAIPVRVACPSVHREVVELRFADGQNFRQISGNALLQALLV